MNKITLLMIVLVLSCAGNMTRSTDLLGDVPRYLGVAVFDGRYPYNKQASSQFAHGLMNMGYQVIERINMPSLMGELKFHGSGAVESDYVTELGLMYGIQAIFVGNVQTVITNHYVDTFLHVRLVEIKTGKTIWSVSAKEPRYFTFTYDMATSVYHTTKQALKHFKQDIRRIND